MPATSAPIEGVSLVTEIPVTDKSPDSRRPETRLPSPEQSGLHPAIPFRRLRSPSCLTRIQSAGKCMLQAAPGETAEWCGRARKKAGGEVGQDTCVFLDQCLTGCGSGMLQAALHTSAANRASAKENALTEATRTRPSIPGLALSFRQACTRHQEVGSNPDRRSNGRSRDSSILHGPAGRGPGPRQTGYVQ